VINELDAVYAKRNIEVPWDDLASDSLSLTTREAYPLSSS
jgi:hypothetical protein